MSNDGEWDVDNSGPRPRPPVRWLRRLLGGVAGPLRHAWQSGNMRSAWHEAAVDRTGHALPWYTYSAIDFLAQRDFSGRRILEWGGGHSTVWWAERASRVTTLENGRPWLRRVATLLQKRGRRGTVDLLPYDVTPETDAASPRPERIVLTDDLRAVLAQRYDVVCIDGRGRYHSLELSLDLPTPDGAIVIDNSDAYWASETSYPLLELVAQRRLSRVDFYGFAPGVSTYQCTSICFGAGCFLFDAAVMPRPLYR